MVLVKLMRREYEYPVADVTPTTTISFYDVNTSGAIEVISYITDRFNQMLQMNPWLTGRLIRQKIDVESGVYLSYDEEIPDNHDYLLIRNEDKLFCIADRISLIDYVSPLKPKTGRQCIGKDEKLCQLLVFQGAEANKIALMFSLSHSLGDGSTFYRLWKMLDTTEVVTSMVIERRHDANGLVQKDTNLQDITRSTAAITKTTLALLGRGFVRKIRGKTPPKTFMYKINITEVYKHLSRYARHKHHKYIHKYVSTQEKFLLNIIRVFISI